MAEQLHLHLLYSGIEQMVRQTGHRPFKLNALSKTEIRELSPESPRVMFCVKHCTHYRSTPAKHLPSLFQFNTRQGVVWIFVTGSNLLSIGYVTGDIPDTILIEHNPNGPQLQFGCVMLIRPQICAECGAFLQKSYKCSTCRQNGSHVRYCSKLCQQAHWPLHKHVCHATHQQPDHHTARQVAVRAPGGSIEALAVAMLHDASKQGKDPV